jgi:hypothetical protein
MATLVSSGCFYALHISRSGIAAERVVGVA